jgi:glycosyltransferase involved in cell wall biosynthesis
MTQPTALLRVLPQGQTREETGEARAPSTLRGKRVVLLQTQAEAAGAQEIARILGQGLSRHGYDVHSVFFFRRTAAYDDLSNTFYCALDRPGGPLHLARMFVGLVRHLRALQPDAVLCFQHYGILLGSVAAYLAGARTVVANRTSAKSLVPWPFRWLDLLFGSIGLFRTVVVNSEAVEREYDAYPSRYRARLIRIDHGFEAKTTALSRQEARQALGIPVDAVLLGCVARLHPGKNLAAAIRLLAGRNWHLALAGQGAARADLSALAAALGVADRVHFVGEMPPDRIGTFLRSLDVFVFPSLAETFGLAPVEAAQAGVPVVANDLEVLRETLSVGEKPCALFVDAGNTQAFAEAVEKVLEDRDLRARLCALGKELSRRYSLDTMVQQYAAMVEAIVPLSRGGDAA